MLTKKTNLKNFLLITTLLLGFYLTSRLVNLTKIPIFTDEAIYIRWGQIARQDALHRFISLTDGKQPLLIWLFMIFFSLPFEVLTSARLVSVATGLLSLTFFALISWRVFKSQAKALLTSLIYIVTPFFFFFDRLAIYDSLLTASISLVIFLEVLLAQTLQLDVALLLGMALGVARLVKSSALFGIILLPSTLLLISWPKKLSAKKQTFLRWLGLSLVAVAISEAINTILRLSPYYHIISQKNHTFIVSFSDFISRPFMRFFGNFRGLFGWAIGFITLPIFTLGLTSLLQWKKQLKEKLFLVSWLVVPFGALAFFGKVIYPRFILFMTIPWIVLSADGLSLFLNKFKNKALKAVVGVLFLGYPFLVCLTLMFQPLKAPIPQTAKNQYISSWPSGWGVNQVVEIIKKEAKDQKVFVGTEGTFGLMPFALEAYLYNHPNVEIKGYWPVSGLPEEALQKARKKTSYFLYYQKPQPPDPSLPLKEVFVSPRQDDGYALRFYQVVLNEETS